MQLSAVTGYGNHCVLSILPKLLDRYPHIDLVISYHDSQRGLTRQAFDVRIVRDELDAVADAAQVGLGLTVSSAEKVLGALRDGTLVQVMKDYEVTGNGAINSVVIIPYPRKKLLPQRIRVLVDYLIEHLRGKELISIRFAAATQV